MREPEPFARGRAFVMDVMAKLVVVALVSVVFPEKVFASERSVEEAAVTVPLLPNEIAVPLTVTEEFWSDALGMLFVASVPPEI